MVGMRAEIQVGAEMRPENGSRRVDRLIAWLAARQHGAVARFQLLALGIGPGAIKRRIGAGRLHIVYRGVYAVGHRKLSAEGRLLAAVLAGGRGAKLVGVSAAAHWGFAAADRRVHVAATTARKQRGIVFHRCRFEAGEVTTKNGIPITTPARTLLDCAAAMKPARLEHALREALYQRHTSLPALRRLLQNHPGHRGAKALRKAIEANEDAPGIARSGLERRFLAFLRRHKLPLPRLNVHVRVGDLDIEADCYWPDQRLIVELDHRSTHARRESFEADRKRDRVAQAAGFRAVRVSDHDLADEPALVADFTALLVDGVAA
jgi:very-short-patch-repair endonuclease